MKSFCSSAIQPSLFKAFAMPAAIRPIHYLGSKLRILPLLAENINKVDPSAGPVCDLFAGSGTVSSYLSNDRSVISVDIQEYSRVLCSAVLNPIFYNEDSVEIYISEIQKSEHSRSLSWGMEPLISHEERCQKLALQGNLEPLCELLESGSLIKYQLNRCSSKDPLLISALKETETRLRKYTLYESRSSLISRYFGGIYFSYLQASHIDMLLGGLKSLPENHRDTFLAAILSTASEAVNTVGKQFAQPLRPRTLEGNPKPKLANQVTRDRNINVVKIFETWLRRYMTLPHTGRSHRVLRADFSEALDALKGQINVIYADPPYTRDHYSRYYHVLETMCLLDNPSLSTVRINGEDQISRGLYRAERYQSPFCIRTKVSSAFSTLFEAARGVGVPLILSYSPYEKDSRARPRLMTIQQIEDLVRRYYRQVRIITAGPISHNKLNASEKNAGVSHDAEILIICEP